MKGRLVSYLLNALRWIGVILLIVLGVAAAVSAIKLIIFTVSELAWRLPKGQAEWDIEILMVLATLSTVLFTIFCFLTAAALFRQRWSRRTLFWIGTTGIGSFVLFIVFAALLGRGLSGMD